MCKKEYIIKIIKNLQGFEKDILKNFKILTAENGHCTGTLVLENKHTNRAGGLHGGMSATLIDCISTYALLTHKHGNFSNVSVNITASYMKSAKVGDEIFVDAKAFKVGKKLAFLGVEIRNSKTGDILVTGEHTVFIMA